MKLLWWLYGNAIHKCINEHRMIVGLMKLFLRKLVLVYLPLNLISLSVMKSFWCFSGWISIYYEDYNCWLLILRRWELSPLCTRSQGSGWIYLPVNSEVIILIDAFNIVWCGLLSPFSLLETFYFRKFWFCENIVLWCISSRFFS